MSASLRRDVVILACAVSAGVHGALVPAHLREGAAAGTAFAAAAALLALLAVAITRSPRQNTYVAAAATAFAALIGSWALATTTGLPLVHPEAEPVTGLALVTKAVEAVGLVAGWTLLRRPRAIAATHPQPKGT